MTNESSTLLSKREFIALSILTSDTMSPRINIFTEQHKIDAIAQQQIKVAFDYADLFIAFCEEKKS